ncbi:hypothetical protein GCM10010425_79340 [Streptomyces spororaveus]|uniref:Uncharacterized protein n=2 Tax=Streptomyces spororaveus TaxID=284039 RepID=A0ABQ3TRG5_9ACTN|nr:hypothetical protein Sspor_81100 [Streptomyces spororaveus]GHI82590.1 hypothetical protein Sspor_81510 [Streptomyces spororaveus]
MGGRGYRLAPGAQVLPRSGLPQGPPAPQLPYGGATMSTPPPIPPSAPGPDAPPPAPTSTAAQTAARGRLGAAEAAIVITAITAVTVLAVLERPVPALLATLAAGTLLVLLPGRAGGRLLALVHALTGPRP